MDGPVMSLKSSKHWRQMLLIGATIIIILHKETLMLIQQQTTTRSSHYSQEGGAAICAIQKGGLRYIDEWVDYHLALGFEKIYIYDNSDDFELEPWHQQRDNRTQIEVRHYPGIVRQISSYNDCMFSIKKKKKQHSWVGFFDIDEYLVVKDTRKYPGIMDFLNTLPRDLGGLAVNWQMFYFNNETKYKPKPVTFRFQGHEPEINHHVKSIARVDFFQKCVGPHHFETCCKNIKIKDSSGNVVEGPFNNKKANGEIVLFHYKTKSVEEYRSRCKRGRADLAFNRSASLYCSNGTDAEIMAAVPPEIISDDSAWKLLKERVPTKYSKFESDPSSEIEVPSYDELFRTKRWWNRVATRSRSTFARFCGFFVRLLTPGDVLQPLETLI